MIKIDFQKIIFFCISPLYLFGLTPYNHYFLSLITQNDGYASPMIDQYYTAGHSLSFASNERDYGALNHFGFVTGNTSLSFILSQALYAPKEKFSPHPPKNDHPYAGFLDFTFAFHHRNQKMFESLAFKIGISGKYAFGRQVQNGIHSAIGVGLAQGWETQIGDEVIVNAYYEWIYKHSLYKSAYFDIEVLPTFEFAFGNANIYGKFHTFLKMGYNLSSTFLPQGIIGENGGLHSGRVYANGLGVFAFVGIGGGYITRKMALEGNLFGKDSYVRDFDLCHWVGNLDAGLSFVSGVLSLTYKISYTSREFSTQDKAHMIGSIALGYTF